MASDKQHSDFPWRAGSSGSIVCDDESLGPSADDPDALEFYGGHVVCETVEPSNRDFIIRVCHAHGDLLAACEACDLYFDENMGTETSIAFQRLRHDITAAITKAKPEQGT